MSKVNIQGFYEELGKNSQMREELVDIKENLAKEELSRQDANNFIEERLIPFAQKHGFEFSIKDYEEYHSSYDDVLELSENDLIAVSGGVHFAKTVMAGALGLTLGCGPVVSPLAQAMGGKQIGISAVGETEISESVRANKEAAFLEAMKDDDVEKYREWLYATGGFENIDKRTVKTEGLPINFTRKPRECSLLDFAAGAGAIRIATWCTLNGGRITLETACMAVASGNEEVQQLIFEQPGVDMIMSNNRVVLAEVAAECLGSAQAEVAKRRAALRETELDANRDALAKAEADCNNRNMRLEWLCRTATPIEREAIWIFVLEQRLTEVARFMAAKGYRPCLMHAEELILQCGLDIALGAAPEGVAKNDGLGWTSDGRVFLLSAKDEGVVPATRTVDVIKNGTIAQEEIALPREEVTRVILPHGIRAIGPHAFKGCGSLTSVEIPASVTAIGEYAFERCRGLTSVKIPAGVTTIRRNAFCTCIRLASVEIPAGVTTIGQNAFAGCWVLKSVTIPEGVTRIEPGVFYACSVLTSVTIPEGVTMIGAWAFGECSGLTSVTIPASLKLVGSDAFRGCSGLTSVKIPASVMMIGKSVFRNCRGLTYVEIPASVTAIGE